MSMPTQTNFQGVLGQYEIQTTEDNSVTFWSEAFGEHAHSLSGARKETEYIYIQGTDLISRLKDPYDFNLLEVGFGTGLGFCSTYEALLNSNFKGHIHYFAVEMDEGLIEWAKNEVHNPLLQNLCADYLSDVRIYRANSEHVSLTVIIGDARLTLPQLTKKIPPFHIIYQDAFSPKRNPLLWTVEWFALLKDLSHSSVVMATYSASSSIRKAMVESGWNVKNRIGYGVKRSSTIADFSLERDENLLLHLQKSPVPPFRDKDFCSSGTK